MFFLLFFILEWSSFGDHTMDEIFEQAVANPVFSIVVTANNRCRKFNQTFFDYAQKMKDSLDVKFTFLDCSKRDFCTKYGVRHLPKFVLIRSSVSKYWKFTTESDPIGWNNFLRYELSSPADNSMQWNQEDIKEQLYSGSAYYHLDVGTKTGNLLNKYLDLSMKNRMYGTAFTYSLVESEGSTLYYYYSNICNNTINNISEKDLENLISFRYLSSYHHFDRKEIKESYKNKFIIYMSNGRQEEKIKIIDQITQSNNCDATYKYGIASTKNDRWLSWIAGKINLMENAVIGLNIENECTAYSPIHQNGTLLNSNFYTTLEGRECQKIRPLERDWHLLDIKMFTQFSLIFLGVAVIIYIISSHFDLGLFEF